MKKKVCQSNQHIEIEIEMNVLYIVLDEILKLDLSTVEPPNRHIFGYVWLFWYVYLFEYSWLFGYSVAIWVLEISHQLFLFNKIIFWLKKASVIYKIFIIRENVASNEKESESLTVRLNFSFV